MRSDSETVKDYLAALPDDRRKAISAVRDVILENLPDGYGETMNWGMISYEVPLETSGKTYNGKPLMYAALASQKNHMAIYLCGLYCIPEVKQRFLEAHEKSGRKLDMGAACIRFKKLEQLDLEAVGDVIASTTPEAYAEISAQAHRNRK